MIIGILMDQEELCLIYGQGSHTIHFIGHAMLKEKQKWSSAKIQMENVRNLRGIYFIDPEDKEFKEAIKNGRKKLERIAPAVPCRILKNCGRTEVERKLDRATSSLVQLDEGNEARDKKLDGLLSRFSVGLAERDRKTEEKIDNMERSLIEKMNEKFSDFGMRISSIERVPGVMDTSALVLPKADGIPLQQAWKQ